MLTQYNEMSCSIPALYTAERYAQMEAELQVLRQRNVELIRDLQEHQNIAATKRVRADR